MNINKILNEEILYRYVLIGLSYLQYLSFKVRNKMDRRWSV